MSLLLLLACTTSAPEAPPVPPSANRSSPPPCSQAERDPRVNFEHVIDGQASACDLAGYMGFLDTRVQVSGPWVQDIRVARSTDGLTFVEVPHTAVVRSAGVPEAIVGPDGRIYLYYVDGDIPRARELARSGSSWFAAHGLVGHGALRLAVSDDGISFQDVPDFGIVGAVRGMLVDPDVRPLPGGGWRMVYIGVPIPELVDEATWQPGAKHRVFSATSTDLVHWTQEGVALTGPYADPTVHCADDGRCLMLSFGLDWSTSTDGGQSFSYQGSWEAKGFAPELVSLPDGRLRVYWNESEEGAAIRSRVSADGGRTWTDEAGSRLEDVYGEAPTVIQLPDGSWLMYHHRFKPGEEKRFGRGGTHMQHPQTQPPVPGGPPPGIGEPSAAGGGKPPAPAGPPGG